MTVELSVADRVARMRIGGPVDQDWAEAFLDRAERLRGRADVGVVLIGGDDRFFCPGGDLHTMSEDPARSVGKLARTVHEGLLALRDVSAPIVARVDGAAAGIGMSLVLACDLAIASRSASFTTAYSAVGLTPDGGMTWLLPRRVGWARATELLITSRTLDAAEAAELGVVLEVVDDERLDERVDALLARLVDGPTRTYGRLRDLLDSAATMTLEEQLEREATELGEAAASAVGREGVAAFLAKRRPDFSRLGDPGGAADG